MRKLLHLADLHLGFDHRYLGERAAHRKEETLRTFERVIEWAIDDTHEVGCVVLAGDLFETHDPDPRLVGSTFATLKRLTASGRMLITVPGNHDEYSYPESVYRTHAATWPGLLVTHPRPEEVARCELGGVACAFYAMAYTAGLSDDVLPPLPIASDAPETRVAVLHGTLDATPTDRSYRIDSDTLRAAGISYAALGHFHKPDEARIGRGVAVYPGTLNGKGFDDPGVEELVLVAFVDGRPQIERVPFPTRPIATWTIDLADFDSVDALLDELESRAQSSLILRLAPIGPRPPGFDPDYLLGRLRDRFFHLDINDGSLDISAAEIDRLALQPTIEGLFVRLLREQMEASGADPRAAEVRRLALLKGLTAFEHARRER